MAAVLGRARAKSSGTAQASASCPCVGRRTVAAVRMVELDQKLPKGKAAAVAICKRQVREGERAGGHTGRLHQARAARDATRREAERPAALAPRRNLRNSGRMRPSARNETRPRARECNASAPPR